MSIREILCDKGCICNKCKDSYPFECVPKIEEEAIRKLMLSEEEIRKIICRYDLACQKVDNSEDCPVKLCDTLISKLSAEINKKLFGG